MKKVTALQLLKGVVVKDGKGTRHMARLWSVQIFQTGSLARQFFSTNGALLPICVEQD